VRERPIIDWLLDNNCRILVPRIVEREILAGQGKYSDAKIAAERLKVNEIEVFDCIGFEQQRVICLWIRQR
jgi:hypothetical protein